VIRAARREAGAAQGRTTAASGARYSMFVAPREGLASLVQALAERLPPNAVRLNSPVGRIAPQPGGGWSLEIRGPRAARLEVDAVAVATPAHRAAPLLAHLDQQLADDLERICYNSCANVSLGYRRSQIAHPLNGFGFVAPIIEQRRILSGSFASVKYPGRAPADFVLLRVFIGGGLQSELVDLPDDRLRRIAVEELADLLRIRGEPVCCRVVRSVRSMPQYELGHNQMVQQIEERTARWPGLALAGNAYRGVGIPHCIHSGEEAAERLLAPGR
jgi:oxygen-dependent protoporphyrinogen oxidase